MYAYTHNVFVRRGDRERVVHALWGFVGTVDRKVHIRMHVFLLFTFPSSCTYLLRVRVARAEIPIIVVMTPTSIAAGQNRGQWTWKASKLTYICR